MGKGSQQRPRLVTYKEYAKNWERAFPKLEKQNESTPEPKYACSQCGKPWGVCQCWSWYEIPIDKAPEHPEA